MMFCAVGAASSARGTVLQSLLASGLVLVLVLDAERIDGVHQSVPARRAGSPELATTPTATGFSGSEPAAIRQISPADV